jgi:hypothetical protein
MASGPEVFNLIDEMLSVHKSTFISYSGSKNIDNILEEVLSQIPTDTEISIVGHSLGGILGHLITLQPNIKVKDLVTISAPFGGSDSLFSTKYFLPNYGVLDDITPQSGTIKKMTVQPRITGKFASLISTKGFNPFINGSNDGIISINSQEAGCAELVIPIATGHFDILKHHQTVNEIEKILFHL